MKWQFRFAILDGTWSLPSWERGLKCTVRPDINPFRMSLPSWERGLKSVFILVLWECDKVAPLVGAWIEIIELCDITGCNLSLPSWERGLKSNMPFKRFLHRASLPSWERGLKYVDHPELICRCSRSPRGSVD